MMSIFSNYHNVFKDCQLQMRKNASAGWKWFNFVCYGVKGELKFVIKRKKND